MNIKAEQIRNLIEDYQTFERQCRAYSGEIAHTRAALYRTVIKDLKDLLPRKSMADIPTEEWPNYVGTWVEYQEKLNVLAAGSGASNKVALIDPKRTLFHHACAEQVFPLEHSPAWDTEGNPV